MSGASFTRNLLTLVSGAALAQAIPIIASPVLARLYSPESFGILGLFVAFVGVIANVINGRYELAIGLQGARSDALRVSRLAMNVAAFLVALISLAVVYSFFFWPGFDRAQHAGWVMLLPVMALFLGLHNVLTYNMLREKRFTDIARSNVLRSAAAVLVQVAAAFMGFLSLGLVVGSFVGLVSCVLVLRSASSIRLGRLFAAPTPDVRALARTYSGYPRHSMPAALANGLSQYAIAFLMPFYFSLEVLGHFVLMQRMVDVPSALIGNSSRQVFYQQAAEQFRIDGACDRAFKQAFIRLFCIAALVFPAAYFLAQPAFVFVFGEAWAEAGRYAQIVMPLAAIRFVVSPLTVANQVVQRTRTPLVFHTLLLSATLAIFHLFGSDVQFSQILSMMVNAHCVIYLLFFAVTLRNVLRRPG